MLLIRQKQLPLLIVAPLASVDNEAIKQKHKTNKTKEDNNMDGKSIIFFITFVIAGILVLLGVHAMSFDGAAITTPKVSMDFIFAAVLAFMAFLQYKVFESAEKG